MEDIKYKNIAIIKLSSLGDIIHTIPAFNILRNVYPNTKISWIVEPEGAELLKNFSGLDECIVLNLKKKGFTGKIFEIKKIIRENRKKFDLIIDFQGLFKSAILSYLLKGDSIGFNKKNLREPLARYFYKQNCGYFSEENHVILKNINLIQSICPDASPVICYPVKNLPIGSKLGKFLSTNKIDPNEFLIINTGGGWETKKLSVDQYIDLIARIDKKYKIVLLWGNREEKKEVDQIVEKTKTIPSIFLNFSELITFIKRARLIVSGDTLAMHIADVVNTPSVGIFGPSSPYRNGSLLRDSVSIYEKMDCGFCYKRKCDTMYCIKNLNNDKIIRSIEKIYEERS